MRLKENEILASAVQGNNHIMCVSIENVFIFPLTRWWLKFWEVGLVEIRMLNGNSVLLLIKCEFWERGAYI